MERYRQTFEEIISKLSPIQSEWRDDLATSVIDLLLGIPDKDVYTTEDLRALLAKDFDAGLTLIRLFLDLSKDELGGVLGEAMKGKGVGIKSLRADPSAFLEGLVSLGALEKMREVVGTPVTWRDILVERLKTGRGSAIKAQKRGKFLIRCHRQQADRHPGGHGAHHRSQAARHGASVRDGWNHLEVAFQ